MIEIHRRMMEGIIAIHARGFFVRQYNFAQTFSCQKPLRLCTFNLVGATVFVPFPIVFFMAITAIGMQTLPSAIEIRGLFVQAAFGAKHTLRDVQEDSRSARFTRLSYTPMLKPTAVSPSCHGSVAVSLPLQAYRRPAMAPPRHSLACSEDVLRPPEGG